MISATIGILNIEVIMNLATRVREEADGSLGPHPRYPPGLNCITSVAFLVHLYQFKMGIIQLVDVNLSKVPTQHLVSLVSRVTNLWITDVTGCDLVALLESANCRILSIKRQSLGREETQALVRAMESRVEMVMLYDVKLDMETLPKYSGQGRCRFLEAETYEITTGLNYTEKLKTWAKEKTWSHYAIISHYYSPNGLRVFCTVSHEKLHPWDVPYAFRQPSPGLSDLLDL